MSRRMRGDQIPVDLSAEQRIDMLVADGFGRTIEDGVTQAAHARHQLDAEQSAETEDRFALALGVGMERVGLDRRAILHQPIQDVDRLPYAAGDEAGEQSDVGVGDVVVGDAAIAAIADMARADQIVFAQLDVRAIGDGGATAAPVSRQWEADILVDHVHHRRLQLVDVDVLGVDPAQRRRRGDVGGVPGGLIGTKIAAIAEHGEEIALDGLREFRIGPGWRSEVPGIVRPVLGMFEDVEEMALRHTGADFLLELRQSVGLASCRQLLQMRRAVRVDAQFAVGRRIRHRPRPLPSSIRPSAQRRTPRRVRRCRERRSRPAAASRTPTKAEAGHDSRQNPRRRRRRDRRSARPPQDGRRHRPQARVDRRRPIRIGACRQSFAIAGKQSRDRQPLPIHCGVRADVC